MAMMAVHAWKAWNIHECRNGRIRVPYPRTNPIPRAPR